MAPKEEKRKAGALVKGIAGAPGGRKRENLALD
jgi:hypothetical protein